MIPIRSPLRRPRSRARARRSRRAGRGGSSSSSCRTQRTPNRRLSRRTVSIRGEIASTGTSGRCAETSRAVRPLRVGTTSAARPSGRSSRPRSGRPSRRRRSAPVGDAVEEPVAVGEVGLGLAGDPVHHPHRLDRVLADRRLLGEHHGVGAVVDRVGDVGHLGPRRAVERHHRGEHLGRGDRRLRVAPGERRAAASGRPAPRSIGSSMPRSPRATMIPLGAASTISSAFSAACGFSIFAISGMSAPRSRAVARPARGPRRGATKETASRSIAVLDREVDPVEVGVAGRGQRDVRARAGSCPWWEATVPPTSTSQRTSSLVDLEHAQPDRARRRGRSRRPRGRPPGSPSQETGRRSASPSSSSVVRVSSVPGSSSTTSPSTSSIRSFGPGRSPSSPTSRPAALARLAGHRDVLGVLVAASPCEKLSRKTSAPAPISSASARRVARGRADRGDDLRPAPRTAGRARRRSCPAASGRSGPASGRAARLLGGAVLRCRASAAGSARGASSPWMYGSRQSALREHEARRRPRAGRGTTARPRAARGRRSRAPARRRGSARRGRRARRPSRACSSGSRCARGPGRARAGG